MPDKFPSVSQVAAGLISGAAYAALAYATPRAQFGQLAGLFAVALLAYAWLLRSRLPWRWGLGLALLFRLLWLPATPALSDDFYRFRWDGLLVAHGANPFQYRPDAIIADGARTVFKDEATRNQTLPRLQELYRALNSPHFYSVYPPVSQVIFGTAARLAPNDAQRVGRALADLASEVDEVVCLHVPEDFLAVGESYRQFPQLADQEVIDLLRQAAVFAPIESAPPVPRPH